MLGAMACTDAGVVYDILRAGNPIRTCTYTHLKRSFRSCRVWHRSFRPRQTRPRNLKTEFSRRSDRALPGRDASTAFTEVLDQMIDCCEKIESHDASSGEELDGTAKTYTSVITSENEFLGLN